MKDGQTTNHITMSAKQTRIPIDSLIFEDEVDAVVTDPYYLCNHNIEYDNYWRHERPRGRFHLPRL